MSERADERGWWDGNSTRVWRILVLAYMGIMGFLGSWAFTQITQVPEKYPNKTEIQCMVDRLDSRFNSLDHKVDRINEFLREKK